ncbi:hypothetical protein RR46_14077 [Papilio xuthus]|uniref:Uncharacterized protein n=1 Tax=Papilio xuthus TaxID=66420 RepID=A0A194PHG7_PAPXU|nr:hypothetical protein RR46_14077 [Papilio xuthus]
MTCFFDLVNSGSTVVDYSREQERSSLFRRRCCAATLTVIVDYHHRTFGLQRERLAVVTLCRRQSAVTHRTDL